MQETGRWGCTNCEKSHENFCWEGRRSVTSNKRAKGDEKERKNMHSSSAFVVQPGADLAVWQLARENGRFHPQPQGDLSL